MDSGGQLFDEKICMNFFWCSCASACQNHGCVHAVPSKHHTQIVVKCSSTTMERRENKMANQLMVVAFDSLRMGNWWSGRQKGQFFENRGKSVSF